MTSQFSMRAACVPAAPHRGVFVCSRGAVDVKGRSRVTVRSSKQDMTSVTSNSNSSPAGSEAETFVYYASFGSNILAERFNCYLKGGRVEGMIRDMPGSRNKTTPKEWHVWHNLPHRLFFAHSSPTWEGGGVGFVDFYENNDEEGDEVDHLSASRTNTKQQTTLGTSYRLYRITLEQFNDVLAQENGMVPGDGNCQALTSDEANSLARKWNEVVSAKNENGAKHGGMVAACVEGSITRENFVPSTGPPGETRAPSNRWYGYAKCIGTMHGECVLTFTCDPTEMEKFRSGQNATNAPSEAYYDVIKKGLVQTGMSEREAVAYLDERVGTSLIAEGSAPVR